MIRREKLHALILSRRNSGEADRVVTLFTRQHGLLRVFAKGVRKIPSRRGGHIEPLTHVIAIVSGKPGHLFLSGVEPQDIYPELRQDAVAAGYAQALAQFLRRLCTEEEAHPTLFDAVHHAWKIFPELSPVKQRLLYVAVVLHALHRLGWMPNLQSCHVCGTTHPSDAVVFSGQQGAWRCLGCHSSLAGTRASLSPQLFKALRFLARHPAKALQLAMSDEESRQLTATLQEYSDQIAADFQSTPSPSLSNSPYGYQRT